MSLVTHSGKLMFYFMTVTFSYIFKTFDKCSFQDIMENSIHKSSISNHNNIEKPMKYFSAILSDNL